MRGLDWSNESYVRLYRRATPEWELLGFEGQAVYLALLPKLDRAGVLPLGSLSPAEAVAAILRWPEQVVSDGLERVLSRGFLIHNPELSSLIDPEYLAREESTLSDRARKREERERRRSDHVTIRELESQAVTLGHELGKNVTGGHAVSRGVTSGHAVSLRSGPFRAVPGLAVHEEPPLTGRSGGASGPRPPVADDAGDAGVNTRTASTRAEIEWRIHQCWEMYCIRRERFFVEIQGYAPTRKPKLTEELRLVIRDAILRHDKDLLAPEDRERWVYESAARASGIGLFRDPWMTGKDPQNDAKNGGRLYLEHWRPWRKLRGKGDPVDRFAELYFRAKDEQVAARAAQSRVLELSAAPGDRPLLDAPGQALSPRLAPSGADDG